MRRSVLVLLAVMVMAAPAAAACREDLVRTAQDLERTRTDLQGAAAAASAAKCAAYRAHVAALNQVKTVFARCDKGADKAKNANQVGASITQFTKEMRASCK